MWNNRVYLDFASATPILPRVARAMARAVVRYPGNPSASHKEGREAFEAISHARSTIARSLSVKPEELVFTSGGTEANNLAIHGFIEALRQRGFSYANLHIISTTIEHSSVEKTLQSLEREGVLVSRIAPQSDGIVAPEDILKSLTPNTVLVTLAHVNSEIGVIQPVSDISEILKKASYERNPAFKTKVPEVSFPVLHTDAAQSPLYLDAGPHVLHADMVSYDAQKIMGPRGAGVLYRDFSIPVKPIMGGGSQERGLRPGTENTAAIVGMGVAFSFAKEGRKKRIMRVSKLRDILITSVRKHIPEAVLVGHPSRRIANNACFAIPGVDGDYLAVLMDTENVSVTPRSACVGSGIGQSEVVLNVTGDKALAKGTIRFSLGPKTSMREVRAGVSALKISLKRSHF